MQLHHAFTPLGRQMRSVLAQLELTSNGTTASPDAMHGGESLRLPQSGDSNPPHVEFRERWNATVDDTQREELIAEAREDLARLTGHGSASLPRPEGETVPERNARMIREGAGWSPEQVSLVFHMSVTEIRKARAAAGCLMDTGYPIPNHVQPESRKRQSAGLVALLAEADRIRQANPGMPLRQVALASGVPRATLSDHWRAQAHRGTMAA
jgi:hypothetical protein